MNVPAQRRESAGRRGAGVMAALSALTIVAALPAPVGAQTQVWRTVHNLSATGQGRSHEPQAAGVCVFCHTPHDASPSPGLWNRELPAVTYKLYESSTLEAKLTQPTGTSRLCLSCHDGILAMGNLRVANEAGSSSLGPLTGKASLGTNLSGDHPISFVYDSLLAEQTGELADPQALPGYLPLDESQLQCSTCHDPHEDRRPNFLRMDTRFSPDCTTCHQLRYWNSSSHATSRTTWNGSGQPPWLQDAYPTVAENACLNCHRVHGAGHPEYLLAQPVEPDNCDYCHNGAVAAKNVAQEFAKPSHHPIEASQWTHQPNEQPATMREHVTCVDCHNPHAATASAAAASMASGALRAVVGVTIGGGITPQSKAEYQVCLKCHGLREPTTPGIIRQDGTRNIRLKINPGNRSYHPIAAVGRNPSIRGLEAGYTASSVISCIDCHNNDQWTSAGIRPRGPHGSRYEPILQQEYESQDPITETFSSYALCYKCHNRALLLGGGPGFPHRQHVVGQSASCAVCHDAHGARRSIALIDFMLRAQAGNTVVRRSRSGRLEFDPGPGPGHGRCYLNCHGAEHNPRSY